MPDFTHQTYYHCISLEKTTWSIGKWTVYKHNGEFECNCPSFKFNRGLVKGKCKHVRDVEKSICGWMEFIDGGYEDNKKCPKCGQEAVPASWAV